MKLDLHKVVELFQKSFSASLSGKEKEELSDVLQDEYLKRIYDQLLDETFVLDKFQKFTSVMFGFIGGLRGDRPLLRFWFLCLYLLTRENTKEMFRN